jgi:hypothetical protein
VKKFIYMYSFALRPEEMQPSGSLNASRIDNMNLMINLRPDSNEPTTLTIPVVDATGAPLLDGTGKAITRQIANPSYAPNRGKAHVVVYARNHNVLRVVNGFAGLLFKI